jgi:tetratricopeptide (TPR) repeat protein
LKKKFHNRATVIAMNDLEKIYELIHVSKYTEALSEVSRVLDSEKENQEAYIIKARILNLTRKKEEAIILYEKIIDKFPAYIDAYLDLVEVYDFEISLKRNVELYSKLIISLGVKVTILDSYKAPFFEMGNAYRNLGEHLLAVEAFNSAIEQKALITRVVALYMREKSQDESVIEYGTRKISDNREIIYDALCVKAKCLWEMDKLNEAIECYLKAIEINIFRKREFESFDEYLSIRNIYDAMGDIETALMYEKKARKLEKINNDAYDKSHGRMTADEFDAWYNNYFEFDKDGNIIGQKK